METCEIHMYLVVIKHDRCSVDVFLCCFSSSVRAVALQWPKALDHNIMQELESLLKNI